MIEFENGSGEKVSVRVSSIACLKAAKVWCLKKKGNVEGTLIYVGGLEPVYCTVPYEEIKELVCRDSMV